MGGVGIEYKVGLGDDALSSDLVVVQIVAEITRIMKATIGISFFWVSSDT